MAKKTTDEFKSILEGLRFLDDFVGSYEQLIKEITDDFNSDIRIIVYNKIDRVWDVWFHQSDMMTFKDIRSLIEWVDSEGSE